MRAIDQRLREVSVIIAFSTYHVFDTADRGPTSIPKHRSDQQSGVKNFITANANSATSLGTSACHRRKCCCRSSQRRSTERLLARRRSISRPHACLDSDAEVMVTSLFRNRIYLSAGRRNSSCGCSVSLIFLPFDCETASASTRRTLFWEICPTNFFLGVNLVQPPV